MRYENINWVFVIALVNFLIYFLQLFLSGNTKGLWHKKIVGFLLIITCFGYIYILASLGSYALNLIAFDMGYKKEIVIISLLGFPLGGFIGKYLFEREMRGNKNWNKNAILLFYFQVFINPLISFLTVLISFFMFAFLKR